MWQNNGFNPPGGFQEGQDASQQGAGNSQQNLTYNNGYIPLFPAEQFNQQWFNQFQPPLLSNGQGSDNGFAPGGRFEEPNSSLTQSRLLNPDENQERFVPLERNTMSPNDMKPMINSRAQELKAQLLRTRKDRGRSDTPENIAINAAKQIKEGNSPRASLATSSRSRPIAVTADDVDDLLSEAKAAADASMNIDDSKVPPSRTSTSKLHSDVAVNPQVSSAIQIDPSTERDSQIAPTRRATNSGGSSDISEGEIRDCLTNGTQIPVTHGDSSRVTSSLSGRKGKVLQQSSVVERGKAARTPGSQTPPVEGRGHVQNSKRGAGNLRVDDRQDSLINQPVPRATGLQKSSDNKAEHRINGQQGDFSISNEPRRADFSQTAESRLPHTEGGSLERRETQTSERRRKGEGKSEIAKTNGSSSSSQPEPPIVTRSREYDEELEEWLELTGYNDVESRRKILRRRRALAELEAQKAKILEEIEQEEHGGGMIAFRNTSIPRSSMPPPAVPVREIVVDNNPGTSNGQATRNQQIGPKRSYAEFQDSAEKVRCPEDDGSKITKQSDMGEQLTSFQIHSLSPQTSRSPLSDCGRNTKRRETVDQLSSSGAQGLSRRRWRSPLNLASHLEDKGKSWDGDDWVSSRRRSISRGRQISPDSQASQKFKGARSKADMTSGSEDFHDREKSKESKDHRTFRVIGNYRGRAFDPNYRGRGRGRGSGDSHAEDRNSSESRYPYGHRIANQTPFKDPHVWDRGGRGG
ncbi:MAG: hypothetical protein M1818_001085 [Claussenomyces sp. TS43310]|nr:MAG: hypothetical protein M1818_001085 [Claussenomyces sp. TS43310]